LIAIVDYNLGNLRSVEKAVRRVGYDCVITRDRYILEKSSKLILPGVGNFIQGMENLKKFGLTELLTELVIGHRKPILGICLGMQVMTTFSEEGECSGLGWVKADTKRFRLQNHKVPHIGWNTLEVNKKCPSGIIHDPTDEFYFVHSYYVSCENDEDILFTTSYEITFTSGFLRENIMGVQFHPEKSHLGGLKILKYFLSD
jgi:imidazole glycerol-phosphate synthase subunit HisH